MRETAQSAMAHENFVPDQVSAIGLALRVPEDIETTGEKSFEIEFSVSMIGNKSSIAGIPETFAQFFKPALVNFVTQVYQARGYEVAVGDRAITCKGPAETIEIWIPFNDKNVEEINNEFGLTGAPANPDSTEAE